jgi:hypothetical protein
MLSATHFIHLLLMKIFLRLLKISVDNNFRYFMFPIINIVSLSHCIYDKSFAVINIYPHIGDNLS